MADYIDSELVKKNICNYAMRNIFSCSDMINNILDVPTADVVERSKIDKAIEEMKDFVKSKSGIEYVEFGIALNSFEEILKRNIGE